MTDLRPDLLVLGAGAFGLSAAVAAARAGARVWLLDAGGANASSVAAGMIAPAFEAGLENSTPERADLYRHAASLWPGFAAEAGIGLSLHRADWIGPAEPLLERLRGLGFDASATATGLSVEGEGLIDPVQALGRLREALRAAGGRILTARALRLDLGDGVAVETDQGRIAAGRVLAATGWSAGGLAAPDLRRQLAAVFPIKGQIVRLSGPAARGVHRVTRGPGVYLAPRGEDVMVGATMEPGISDPAVEPAATDRLRRAAEALVPALAEAELTGAWTGVRGATTDGLPLAGATRDHRLLTALGPRRNGWLLAPLAARIIADVLGDRAPGPWAEALDPERDLAPIPPG